VVVDPRYVTVFFNLFAGTLWLQINVIAKLIIITVHKIIVTSAPL
jgi:hypothetical protein